MCGAVCQLILYFLTNFPSMGFKEGKIHISRDKSPNSDLPEPAQPIVRTKGAFFIYIYNINHILRNFNICLDFRHFEFRSVFLLLIPRLCAEILDFGRMLRVD